MQLETDRLILRKSNMADFDRFWSMVTDPAAKQYTGGVTKLSYTQRLALFEQECAAEFSSQSTEFAVIEKSCDRYLGYCGFRFSETLNANEFLYGFCRDTWGKGFATEAALAVLQFLFDTYTFDSYMATVHPQNTASIKVLEKVGFIAAGINQLDKGFEHLLYRCQRI